MSNLKILATAIQTPAFSSSTKELLPYVRKWLEGNTERFIKKSCKIFEMSGIERRYSIMPPDDVFTATSFEEKNGVYMREMKKLTCVALKNALKKASLSGQDLDAIITVSCTGFMIPSMDAYIINELKLKENIYRLPVTEMGCAAGTSAMIYAENYLKGNPEHKLAIVAFESPTATLLHADQTMTNVVSTALFGDGVAAVILGDSEELRPEIVDSTMFHMHDEIDLMGFNMTNSGLQMVLDPQVPDKIEYYFDQFFNPFLEKNNIEVKDIDHLLFHPGGKKIVQFVEEKFKDHGQTLEVTKKILKEYGNMSSATVFYVLDEFLKKDVKKGDLGMMLSFGPGFTAQLVLLRWNF